MPLGEEVIVPPPPLLFVTVRLSGYVLEVPLLSKVAVTFWLEVSVTRQVPVPEQTPPQPWNVEPLAGVAVRATFVPPGYDAVLLAQPVVAEPVHVKVPFALLTVPLAPFLYVVARLSWY